MKRTIMTMCALVLATAAMAQAKKDYAVGQFSQIRINTVGDVDFVQSDECTLSVEGDQKHIDDLVVTLRNGELTIANKKKKSERGQSQRRLKFRISCPMLTHYEGRGVCSFSAQRIEQQADLEVKLSGVSNFKCTNLHVGDFVLSISGVGNISNTSVTARTAKLRFTGVANGSNLSIESESLSISDSGVDNTDISFRGKECTASYSGVGNGTLHVDCAHLKATTSGVANLTVSGTADEAEVNSTGVTKIKAKDLNKF